MTERRPDILSALYSVYPEAAILMNANTAHMVVEGQRMMSWQGIPSVDIEAEESEEAITIHIRVAEGVQVPNPIHSCVGLMATHGAQHIRLHVELEPGSSAHILAHCLFPNAELVKHVMEARVEVGEGAELRHTEGHFYGPYGGIEVRPQAYVNVHPGGRYFSDFSLTSGRVGLLNVDYQVQVGDDAVAEIAIRVFGHATDEISVRVEMILGGRNARGLIKTRVAVEDDASSEVIGITHGKAEGARGHMDCTELVRDRAVARAEPIVNVEHPLAKVTHEAAIGSVDQKQLETLMAHGLTPDEAVDVIIMGLLR
ncbi:MAG: SufD family Fe-S cluster assembly protein [Candidatus Sedimenticola sp. (ex Thyasira tokunagai)]